MRVVAVGDLHGDLDNLWRVLDREKPDALVSVGDWGDPGEVTPESWRELLARVPVLTVFGNHDDLELLVSLRNGDGTPVLLDQGERRSGFAGLCVAGVSGIWAKSHRLPHYVTDEDVAGWAEGLADGVTVDLLLTHGCPLGVADRTPSGRPGGQRCFLDLLHTVHPRLYLCGHLHLAQRRDLADPPAVVLNTGALPRGDYAVIEIAPTGLRIAARRLL